MLHISENQILNSILILFETCFFYQFCQLLMFECPRTLVISLILKIIGRNFGHEEFLFVVSV